MVTLLCASIMAEDIESALAEALEARALGADMVEWRIDSIFHGEGDDAGREAIARLVDDSPLPCIVTCRAAAEGGHYDGDDASRISLYEWLAARDRPPRYIDIELATLQRSANLRQKVLLAVEHSNQPRALTTGLILSTHDFEGRPADLFKRLSAMQAEPATAVRKVAFRARSLRDNLELFEILADGSGPTIALGMGEFGAMSRILAPKFGGFLTFAAVRASAATAPGQPTITELVRTYRFRAITPSTRVYGIIGHPVGHSLSPKLHNAGFSAVGHDGVYIPMPIAPGWEPFKATLLAMLDDPRLGFSGASITIPHKEHLVRLAREDSSRAWRMDDTSTRAGAANTLTIDPDGSCIVTNTDAPAVVEVVRTALAPAPVAGASITILGAGGAARSAAVALAGAGAAVRIINRTAARAAALAADVRAAFADAPSSGNIEAGAWDDVAAASVIINCTPVGMAGGPEPQGLAVPGDVLAGCAPSAIVFDTVYAPRETPLIRAAAARGLRTVGGWEMFLAQATGQFRAWTGRDLPRRAGEDGPHATDIP